MSQTIKNPSSLPNVPTLKHQSSTNLTSPKKLKKVNSFFKKASAEFNLFLLRIKSLGDEVFSENQVISELFIETDNESVLDRLDRHSKGYSLVEERFLSEYKKYKTLDKMYENFQHRSGEEDLKSSSTAFSENQLRFSLKDVIRQTNSTNGTTLGSPLINETIGDEEDEVDEDDEIQELDSDQPPNKEKEINFVKVENKNGFGDVDFIELRRYLEKERFQELKNENIGEILWEYRRNQWTNGNVDQTKIAASRLFFDQIPKDSYVKVYSNLVDKGRSLRPDRRINLFDLMKIINAGWVAEEKWERAAKGLA